MGNSAREQLAAIMAMADDVPPVKPWAGPLEMLGSPIDEWRLYYVGGYTFDNTQGMPWEAPWIGVIGVGQPHVTEPARPVLINGHAFMFRTDWNCWMEVDNQRGVDDNFMLYARYIVAVRYGLWIRRDRWQLTMRRIQAEVDASK